MGEGWSNFIDGFREVGNWIGDTFFGGSHSTNQANMAMNTQNIAYQQKENEITREREDNAVQRAAADMTAAGLSKTLAAGNPASAQSMTAPSNTHMMEKNLAGLNAIKFLKELHFEEKADKRADAKNDAEIDLLKANTDAQHFANSVQMQTWSNEQDYKKALTAQSQAMVNYYDAQNRIASITGDNLQKQIDSDLALKTQQTMESFSRTELNNMSMAKMEKEIDKISEEIISEQIHQDYYKALTDYEKEQVILAIKSQTKAYWEIERMKHDLNYAQQMNLPVGTIPNGTAGSIINAGNSLLTWLNNYVSTNYKNGVKWNVIPTFGFDGSASMQYMPNGNSGGGHAW